MRRLTMLLGVITLVLLGGILLALVACRAGETPALGKATPELSVVVFATQAPTPPPTETSTLTPALSPDAARTSTPAAVAEASSNMLLTDRPSNVNPLTGLTVKDLAVLDRRPLMVRVGNDPAARPQVGLNQADIVYEELVEWWVTRFTAIYLSQDPKMIAPIRSARLINLQLTSQYQGALANSGGSDPVRWELSQSDIVNLDEFFAPQPYFYRENEGWQTRLAVDATAARDYMLAEALESDVDLRGFVFSEKLDPDSLPKQAVADAEEVIIPYPSRTSEAKWQYNQSNGNYLRFTTGEPMMDFTGKQIASENVIIYFAEHQDTDIVEDSTGATSVRIIVNGKGTAWLVRDGKILKGAWQTDGRETPLFTFDDGRPMPLKPGNTWIEVAPLDYVIEIDGVDHARQDAAASEQIIKTPATKNTSTPTDSVTLPPTPIGAREDR